VGVTGGPAGHSYAKTGLFGMGGKAVIEHLAKGRFPANVILSHSSGCRVVGTRQDKRAIFGNDRTRKSKRTLITGLGAQTAIGEVASELEVYECELDCPVRLIDEQSGNRPGMSGGGKHRNGYKGGMFGAIDSTHTARGDQGGAARFFYTAKTSRKERERGLDNPSDDDRHPTVKPLAVCRYFARMLLPPPRPDGKPRRLLVPYSGSGSEMIGALQVGWDEVVGIELDPKYADTARARIARGKILQ
jgi:hypothetical protein